MGLNIPAPPPATPPAAEATPARALFTHAYGFFTDDDTYYGKSEGEFETRPDRVRELIERKAPILTDESAIAAWHRDTALRREALAAAARLAAAPRGH